MDDAVETRISEAKVFAATPSPVPTQYQPPSSPRPLQGSNSCALSEDGKGAEDTTSEQSVVFAVGHNGSLNPAPDTDNGSFLNHAPTSNGPEQLYLDPSTPSPSARIRVSQPRSGNRSGNASCHQMRISKIAKPSRRSSVGSSRQIQKLKYPDSMPRTQPSEEDLIYLLMSRVRQTAGAIKKLEHLEEQNETLRRQNELSDVELEGALAAQAEIAEYNNSLGLSLHVFKEKYYKLKKWAFEANKDCEMLHTATSELKKSLAALTKDKEVLLSRLRDLQSLSGKSTGQMDTLHARMRGLKAVVEGTVSETCRMDGILFAQGEHLRSEKQKCRKLESHILHLEQEKNKQNIRLHGQHHQLNDTLQQILAKLQALTEGREHGGSEDDPTVVCQALCQSLLDKDLATGSDLNPLKGALGSMAELIVARTDIITQTLQTTAETIRQENRHDISAQVSTLFSAVRVENNELLEARTELARLKQEAEQHRAVLELLQNARDIAEHRESHLQTTTVKLIDALGENKGDSHQQIIHLQDQVSSLLAKWQSASSALDESKQETRSRAEEMERLETKLNQATQDGLSLRSALVKAEERLTDSKKQIEQQSKDESNRLSLQIHTLGNEMAQEIQKRQMVEHEVNHYKLLHSQTQGDLDKAHAAVEIARSDKTDLQVRMDVLERELAAAQEDVLKMDEVVNHLEATNIELDSLKQQESECEQLKEKSLLQEREIGEHVFVVQSLHDQIRQIQENSAHLEGRLQFTEKLEEEKRGLEKEITEVRKQLFEKADLETKLEQRNAIIAEVESALSVARKQAAEAEDWKEKHNSLTETITSLNLHLEGERQENAQIASLKDTIGKNDEKIASLKDQLKTFIGQTKELGELQAEGQRKDKLISSLQQQLMNYEAGAVNADLVEMLPAPEQRNVTDRSEGGTVPEQRDCPQTLDIQDVGFLDDEDFASLAQEDNRLGAHLTLVPETQFDIQATDGGAQNGSALHQPPSNTPTCPDFNFIPQDTYLEGDAYHCARVLGEDKAKHQTRQNLAGEVAQQIEGSDRAVERPPSSSYGSLSDPMLLDPISQGDAPSGQNRVVRPSALTLESDIGQEDMSGDVDQNTVMASNSKALDRGRSPTKLRNRSRARQREATPSLELTPEPRLTQESTPKHPRERHRPNSAVKRRGEYQDEVETPQGPSKRLKRTPANLEVKATRNTSPKTQPGDQGSGRLTISFRKSSTVVGTNAPAPGKGQRTSKPARRGSRQDRYTNRFSAGT